MEAGETEWHTFALANAAEALEDFRRTIGYSLSGAGSSPRSLIWVLCPARTLPAGAFSRPKAARCPRYSPLGESRSSGLSQECSQRRSIKMVGTVDPHRS